MKKILLILIITILTITISSIAFAGSYKFNDDDKKIINSLSKKIENLLYKNSLEFRDTLSEKINQIQKENKKSKKLYNIFEEIKKNTHLISNKPDYEKHYKNYNIDYNKVKTTWIIWHNKARLDLGIGIYNYDGRLDSTSFEWSKKQQTDGFMSHERESQDEHYDYQKIEKWFNVRGVKCKVKNRATTSESIGKYGYYCRDGECTSELLESLKEIFDIYMAEKGLGYPEDAHYRGITHVDLSRMGIGIIIKKTSEKDWYEYYMTTHYCTEFKK